jgi:tetratricopeptide (TPR) repeat protein
MQLKDQHSHATSGASTRSIQILEHAYEQMRCLIGDPVATADAALAESPKLIMASVLKAWASLLGTEPSGAIAAQAALRAVEGAPANERERLHLRAIAQLCEGQWRGAARTLEDLNIAYPRDLLALQAGHQLDFFIGDSRMLRDRIARAMPQWNAAVPGYHAVLGMHAFGLEECGDYARAESLGRRAVELEPRDGWAQHAVAHVLEMQDRRRDGITWMRSNADAWSEGSFFAVHNWWHLALFHLGLDEIDEALRLFDGAIYGKASGLALDMIDASALLWRLHLRGIDPGNRWEALAANWAPLASARNYAFNDMHAVMAFTGAGRSGDVAAVLHAQRAAIDGGGDNAEFTRDVGYAATRAIKAFGDGDYAESVRLLRLVRNGAHRFGGSHAQRDLIDLTLIEAAARSGQEALAAALHVERVDARRSRSPLPALQMATSRDLRGARAAARS